ncbi:MarR family transcriptional regulator [Stappia sp. F7233]|uniref:MarR family transcriptional regulator n=1 Tax=Stappia albiluteola TaxID=2758565 RepID=A0A839AID4_9HYPH|nr:MarR family transcriptional regulator [Stappia albiluteola]MBA5778507.1 MarR family transcriptional regulator [Stappia albiluteola]
MEDQLAYLIASVNRQLEEELAEKLRPEGVPIEQMRILSALERNDGLAMGDLAAQVLVDSTTLTKIIDRMVTALLVYRAPDPHDRRKVIIFLSPQGRSLIGRLQGIASEQQEKIMSRLKGGKADELKRLLRDLMQA